jgi:hypothetical protein
MSIFVDQTKYFKATNFDLGEGSTWGAGGSRYKYLTYTKFVHQFSRY